MMPAASRAAISEFPIDVPFLSTSSPVRIDLERPPRLRASGAAGMVPNSMASPMPPVASRSRVVISPLIAHRDLRRRHCADGEPDRGVNARRCSIGHALRFPDARGNWPWVLLRAERADIETIAAPMHAVSAGSSIFPDRPYQGDKMRCNDRPSSGGSADIRPLGHHLDVTKALRRRRRRCTDR